MDETEGRRAKGTGAKFAYETIRDEILTLALAPGQLLDETTLAERFAMSRSPVREALIRLAGEDLVVMLANGFEGSEAALGRTQISTMLEAAVAGLPAELRLVFLLHEAEGLGVLAIARTLSLNPITVRTRLFRARKRLRAGLEARLRGGFEAIFPFDGARCAHMADRVIADLRRKNFFGK